MTRILLTNDDGIHSQGLIKLEEALKDIGDVYVVAPAQGPTALALPGFRLHVLAAWTLFAFWPFSRLVHVFSAPSATSPGRTSCTAAGTCSSAPAARVGTRPVKG